MTAARKFTQAQKAELRDSMARSRVEAQDEMRKLARRESEEKAERRRSMRLAAAPPPPVPPRMFDIAGEIAELITALEIAAGDLDDDDFSALVYPLRQRCTAVGNYIARKRQA